MNFECLADAKCYKADGTCQDNTIECTGGEYRSYLCGGGQTRKCCVSGKFYFILCIH